MAKKKASKKTPAVSDVVGAVNRIAPPHLAESWDNVGLQFGDPAQKAGKIFVALEITSEVLAEAEKVNAGTIVTHHPLLFKPPKSLAENAVVPRLAARIIRNRMAMIAAHTNFDSVAYGTNGELADRLDVQAAGRRFLKPAPVPSDEVEIVVFVPAKNFDDVFEAITKAGAGIQDRYTKTTFRLHGLGTFLPSEKANPSRGEAGKLAEKEEFRLEAVCTYGKLQAVLRAIHEAHPDEQPGIDVFPLVNTDAPTAGLGLIGSLKKPVTIETLIRRAKKTLNIKSVGLVGDRKKTVETVAICTGAGGDFVRNWRPGTADLFITGEMNHHDCHEAHERGLPVLLVGHWASEAIASKRFADLIGQTLGEMGFPGMEPVASKAETNPLQRL